MLGESVRVFNKVKVFLFDLNFYEIFLKVYNKVRCFEYFFIMLMVEIFFIVLGVFLMLLK